MTESKSPPSVPRSYWKDETTFSQGATDKTPRAWKRWDGLLRLSVHRHIHHAPDRWLLTCEPWFNRRELSNTDADAAKAEAEALVMQVLEGALLSLKGSHD